MALSNCNHLYNLPGSNPSGQCLQDTGCLVRSNDGYALSASADQSCHLCLSPAALLDVNVLDHLSEPLNTRTSLVKDTNTRHDPFERLPNEMISRIFEIYCHDELLNYHNKPPLVIGNVCRRWRDVTLGTPQLWSTVRIFLNLYQPYYLDVVVEWLCRSGSLPLTLHVGFNPGLEHGEDDIILSLLLDLLRSHSARWRDLFITAWNPSSSFPHRLLNDLENSPSDFRDLQMMWTGVSDHVYNTDRLVYPKTFRALCNSSPTGLPVGLDRLTSIDVRDALFAEELIHIIANAPLLRSCILLPSFDFRHREEWEVPVFTLPDTPIISNSIVSLTLESSDDVSENILKYLTLPSLETLCYKHHYYSATDDTQLKPFLDRSSPPLQEFEFTFELSKYSYDNVQWMGKRFPITLLKVDISFLPPTGEEQAELTNDFLYMLTKNFDDEGLPRLRQLEFTLSPTPGFWSALCDCLRQCTSNPGRVIARELITSVAINFPQSWDLEPVVSMDPSVFSLLSEMENSGLDITVSIDPSMEYRLSSVPEAFLNIQPN